MSLPDPATAAADLRSQLRAMPELAIVLGSGFQDALGGLRGVTEIPYAKIPGFRCHSPEGAFYAWVNIEDTGLSAQEVQRLLLEEAGVAAIAGEAFGAEGKNYLRFSLVSARHLLEDALDRIQRVSVKWRAVTA